MENGPRVSEDGNRASKGDQVIGGRYRVVQALKPGLGLETLLAVDSAQGDRVVTKTIPAEGLLAAGVAQLEHDAEALRRVRGHWVAGLRRFGREDDRLYFVTPHIPGVSLRERLAGGPLSVAETLVVGRCLLAGLREVHGLGVLHRAIKPSNIIVDENAAAAAGGAHRLRPDPRGAADRRRRRTGSSRRPATSRPSRRACSTSRSTSGPTSTRSGRSCSSAWRASRLFPGDEFGEVLRQHLASPPPMLRDLGIEAPRALDEVIQRLLRQDPRDRYQSADGGAGRPRRDRRGAGAGASRSRRSWSAGATAGGRSPTRRSSPASDELPALEAQLERRARGTRRPGPAGGAVGRRQDPRCSTS